MAIAVAPSPFFCRAETVGGSNDEEVTLARFLPPMNASIAGCVSQPDTEAGVEKWLKLNADYAKTWPNITVKRDPPADLKEWECKPDKLKYFSPNPGAGD